MADFDLAITQLSDESAKIGELVCYLGLVYRKFNWNRYTSEVFAENDYF